MEQYAIYLVDHNKKPLNSYFYSILENGKEIKNGTADHNGMILLIKKDFVGKSISFLIYNEIYKKGTIPPTEPFYLTKEMDELFVIAPEIFEVSTRENNPKADEEKSYVQAYYTVKAGDTWASIKAELDLDDKGVVAMQYLNHFPLDDTVIPEIGRKLVYYMGMKRFPHAGAEKKLEQMRSKNTGNPVDVLVKTDNRDFDWFETPIVNLIVSKESHNSFNAYNITGFKLKKDKKTGEMKWKFHIYESHFEKTTQYHIEAMTLAEIRRAQSTKIGAEKKHLFAIGIFQMIPDTLFGKNNKGGFCEWVKIFRKIDENTQLFDRNFQQLSPLYFFDIKKPLVGKYFQGKTDVKTAAYSIAQEWASAAVPEELPLKKQKNKPDILSDGYMSYYRDGINKAHYPATKTIEALIQTKEIIDEYGGYEKVKSITLNYLKK